MGFRSARHDRNVLPSSPVRVVYGLSLPILLAAGCGSNTTTESPGAGNTCSDDAGCLRVLASSQSNPVAIAVDATNAYWINSCGGLLMAPIAGGTPTDLIPGAVLCSNDLAIDSNNAYVTVAGDPIHEMTGVLIKVPLFGDSPRTELASGLDYPAAIAVDASSVYWLDENTPRLMKVPINGGQPVVLAADLGPPFAIALDANNVYWSADQGNGASALMRTPKGGGQTVTMVDGQYLIGAIAVYASKVYWTTGTPTIMSVPCTGGSPTLFAAPDGFPSDIAIDGTGVYWTESGGKVVKAPLAGGTVVTLASDQAYLKRIALDARNVYWITGPVDEGKVMVRAR